MNFTGSETTLFPPALCWNSVFVKWAWRRGARTFPEQRCPWARHPRCSEHISSTASSVPACSCFQCLYMVWLKMLLKDGGPAGGDIILESLCQYIHFWCYEGRIFQFSYFLDVVKWAVSCLRAVLLVMLSDVSELEPPLWLLIALFVMPVFLGPPLLQHSGDTVQDVLNIGMVNTRRLV